VNYPFKGIFTHPLKYLLTIYSHTFRSMPDLLFLWNIKEQNLRNVSGFLVHTIKINGKAKGFVYQHSSKYLVLCSAEERKSEV